MQAVGGRGVGRIFPKTVESGPEGVTTEMRRNGWEKSGEDRIRGQRWEEVV